MAAALHPLSCGHPISGLTFGKPGIRTRDDRGTRLSRTLFGQSTAQGRTCLRFEAQADPLNEALVFNQTQAASLCLCLPRRPGAALETLKRQVARSEPLDVVQLLVEQVEVILFVDDQRFKKLL